MKSYIVIGLGRFGAELATKLYECGEEVLAVDTNETIVDKIADHVTRAVAADARDLDVLEKLGTENFDRAVVAVGSDLAASALITMNLKTLNVPFIICKAHDDTYKDILSVIQTFRSVSLSIRPAQVSASSVIWSALISRLTSFGPVYFSKASLTYQRLCS